MEINRANSFSSIMPVTQIRNNTPVDPVTKIRKLSDEEYRIKDTYEKNKDRIKTDFGGYDRTGRRTGVNNAGYTKGYVVDDVADILKISGKELTAKMQQKSLKPEDLVEPEKLAKLSNNEEEAAKLSDYASAQRADLMKSLSMNEEELTGFLNELRNA